MVLVLNVTQSSEKAYDMSYGKCFQPKTGRNSSLPVIVIELEITGEASPTFDHANFSMFIDLIRN